MRKFLLLMCALLGLGVSGAWATTYTITYGTSTGSFYDGSGNVVTSGWIAKWVSNEVGKPKVTLTASANNINAENGRMAPGSSTTCTYTLYVEGGYKVTGFSMNCPTSGADVTVTPAGESATVVSTGGTLVVNSSAASFVYSGSNSGRILAGSNDSGSFTITVEEEDWAPSIEGAFLTVGDKVSSFTAATAADDNDHWYILTQVRDGETPMYNTGVAARLRRASNPFTLSSLDGALNSTNSAYLIRFKSVGEGTYNIQFANGYWIDGNLNAANFNTAGTYAFYNCNGGSGSYFAWNLNSKSGSIVDNNAAGQTVAFWSSGEVSGTSGNNVWYMYETEVEVPASTIDVTYAQYVDGVATGTTYTETVLPNSAINVPSSFYTGYSSLAYDYSTSGTIADADVTIQVNIDRKSDVKLPAELSNSKKYQIICERGGLSTYYDEANSRTVLASPVKTELGVSAKEFAILNYDSKYYLYSVSDSKFVTYQAAQIAPLAEMITGTSDAIAFSQTTSSVFVIRFNNDANKNLNSSDSYTYGIVINDWGSYTSDWDGGCQYVIKEVGDFDATTPLAALEDFFTTTPFNNAIAELKAINWGLTASGNKGKLNYYNFIGTYVGYAGNEMGIIESLESAGYSTENLATAQDILANGYALNMPTTGKFYRIKGYSNNYITSNTAGNNASMNGTASANNIVYYNASQNLIFFGSGYGLYNTHTVAPAGNTLNAYTFSEGAQSSHYYVKSNASGMGTYCYDNTASGTKVDRNTNPVTSGSYQTDWTLEEVTTLPVTISSVGYATLYAPVALSIPDGVAAYIASDEGSYLLLTAIDDVIPANVGVILKAAEGTYNFDITEGGSVSGNVLTGTTVAIDRPNDSYVLSGGDHGLGFYKDGAETIPGFKAYLQGTAGVKGFLGFEFNNTDAINELVSQKSFGDDCYDLSGRRVSKPVRGLYIVNGKKVVIK